MMNFHQWNSAYHPDIQVPEGFGVWGKVVWDACAVECAKLCGDCVKVQEDTESSRFYTFADERWKKALKNLGDSIEDH